MEAIRILYWVGTVGWGLVFLNFLAGWVLKRTLLRFIWVLAAGAGVVLLLERLVVIAPWVRTWLDVGMAIGGAACGVALVARYVNNPKVIE